MLPLSILWLRQFFMFGPPWCYAGPRYREIIAGSYTTNGFAAHNAGHCTCMPYLALGMIGITFPGTA